MRYVHHTLPQVVANYHADYSRSPRVIGFPIRIPGILTLARPGRIHHCMRSIGAASAALDLMIQRVTDPARKTFGKYLYQHGALCCVFFGSLADAGQEQSLLMLPRVALRLNPLGCWF